MKVLKRESLVSEIRERVGIHKEEATDILDAFLKIVEEEVMDKGNDVALVNFGRFSRVHKRARMGRNPKTKEPFEIQERSLLKFHPANKFKSRIEGNYE
ncbi:HU family DNA-binding protein [Vibrio marisflavi]|uniref:DNA-binding protein HRL53 n=1 Tax=Vibrio marisflavi CECT 7928 TaxID=634439 RepID=A0ABN8ECN4_9VIBR|nr:HU family DNA-binding protein [Vibrio marisflavi]CAH0543156.1 DNA-binding protein HRL53 [Vibrio marisflavi CECT 7928]